MPQTPIPHDQEYEELLLADHPSDETGRTESAPVPRSARKYNGPESRAWDNLALKIALTCTLLLAVTTWILMRSRGWSNAGWFAYHPTLQTAALVLYVYGIMTLQTTSMKEPHAKAAGFVRHQRAVFYAAFPILCLGTLAIWSNKVVHEKPHFTTLHSKVGALAVVWVVVQILVGGGSVWFKGAAFGGGSQAKAIYKYHRVSGYILITLLLLTSHLGGAWSSWGQSNGSLVVIMIYTLPLLLTLGAITIRIRTSKMNFR